VKFVNKEGLHPVGLFAVWVVGVLRLGIIGWSLEKTPGWGISFGYSGLPFGYSGVEM
jgi:hypothetical protein